MVAKAGSLCVGLTVSCAKAVGVEFGVAKADGCGCVGRGSGGVLIM